MKKNIENKKITSRDQIFIREYLIDLDPQRAALAAGYKETVARTKAYRWVSDSQQNEKPHVRQEVLKLAGDRAGRLELTMDRVLLEYKRLALLDLRKAFKEDGGLKDIHDIDDDTAAAISSIECDDLYDGIGEDREKVGVTRKIKTFDKRSALADVMRHLGGFEKDNEQQNKNAASALAAAALAVSSANITIKQASDIYKNLSRGK